MKSHRPWQPRISDSPAFNPFSHGTESTIDLSAQIEEAEERSPTAAASSDVAATDAGAPAESVESMPAEPAEEPSRNSRWYADWLRKLTRH